MHYLFVTDLEHKTQMFQGDLPKLLRAADGFEALGYAATIFDEAERQRYASLTARLIELYPELEA